MKLTQVCIKGLFGRFDHDFSLTSSEQITILTAPNGYGKTAVLSIITFFFSTQFSKMRRYEFDSVELFFSNNTGVIVTRHTISTDEPTSQPRVELLFDFRGLGSFEPFRFTQSDERLAREMMLIERQLPFLTRVGADTWIDDRNGRPYSWAGILDAFEDVIPNGYRRPNDLPVWLNSLIKSTECHMIETQRLLRLDIDYEGRHPGRRPKQTRSVVEGNAEDLAQKIGDAIKEYATQSQKLDQSFPKRMVQQFGMDAPSEEIIRGKLQELEEKRTQLVSAGILNESGSDQITALDKISDGEIRNFLRVYSDDTQKKLNVFEDLYKKIDAFQSIIASHLTFKKLKIDLTNGMTVKDDEGRTIPLNSLSSGEQHELVMIYDLLFRVSDGALILIDEPELSLHVAWQKRFINDIQKIQQLRPLTIVIATHSPQIINDRWDLVAELDGGESEHN